MRKKECGIVSFNLIPDKHSVNMAIIKEIIVLTIELEVYKN